MDLPMIARVHVPALVLVVLASSCQDRASAPQIRPEESPPVQKSPPMPADPELGWLEVTKHIEAGNVTWVVPALDRRVFVTLKNGHEHVTTAPTNSALDELLKRVDPSKKTIAVARKYANYREIAWRDIPAFIARSKILVVQQNGGRRVLIDTVDEESAPNGFYVTMQPHDGDITPLVPEKYPNGMFVKHIKVREISWQMATDELTLNNVSSLFLAHGDVVYMHTKDGRHLMTVEPSREEANSWLKTYRPDFQNITVE